MISSLTEIERAKLYADMTNLILNKSELVKENYSESSQDVIFTKIVMQISLGEVLCYICDYILRPDRYVLTNPTLQYIWADMVIDLLTARYNLENTDSGGSGGGSGTIDATNISELKQGDTTIKMKSEVTSPTGHTLNLDDTLKDYKRRLNLYRRPI